MHAYGAQCSCNSGVYIMSYSEHKFTNYHNVVYHCRSAVTCGSAVELYGDLRACSFFGDVTLAIKHITLALELILIVDHCI
jgi:hypothetical protein